jgi:hypothetical protein
MTREELELTETNVAEAEISPELLAKVTAAFGTAAQVTPYRMSKVLSGLLGRTVQGPMMYNYRNKKFGFVSTMNETGHWTVTRDEAIRFSAKFVLKNLNKV